MSWPHTPILYTAGYLDTTAPDGTTEFGLDRLRETLGGARSALTLERIRLGDSCDRIASR